MATDFWFTPATQLNDQFQDFQRLPATAAMPMFRQPFEQQFESRSSVRSRQAKIWPNSAQRWFQSGPVFRSECRKVTVERQLTFSDQGRLAADGLKSSLA